MDVDEKHWLGSNREESVCYPQTAQVPLPSLLLAISCRHEGSLQVSMSLGEALAGGSQAIQLLLTALLYHFWVCRESAGKLKYFFHPTALLEIHTGSSLTGPVVTWGIEQWWHHLAEGYLKTWAELTFIRNKELCRGA